MPRKVFVAGEILTAADVNTNLMDQSVMVFDDASARTTAIPTPVEGMVTYLSDEDEVQVFDGSAFKAVGPGKILQVVSTVKTDTFSTASTTFTDVTGLSVSITPSSTGSKVLVNFNTNTSVTDANLGAFRLVRDSTPICVGDAAGDRRQATVGNFREDDVNLSFAGSMEFLDSPATTSSTTYKVQMAVQGGTGFVNRTAADSDGTASGISRLASTITVMEVAG